MKRLLSVVLACAVLLSVNVPTVSAAGTSEDPLASLSFVSDWAEAFLTAQIESAKASLQNYFDMALVNSLAVVARGVGSELVTMPAGSALKVSTGSSVMLMDGVGTMSVLSGEIVNVSSGVVAQSGSLNPYERYIVCENSEVTVSFSEAGSLVVDGYYEKLTTGEIFTDVLHSDWFYDDVYTAVGLGLVDGMTPTTYMPNGNLTFGQAVKLAAGMHEIYHTGEMTLSGEGEFWYMPYAEYALAEGIIAEHFEDYNETITRLDFVHIFYMALPADEYVTINDIADGFIPDTVESDMYGTEIYTMYRAGILGGYSDTEGFEDHAFGSDTNIRRSEVAAILTRMMDADARLSFE